MLFNIIDKPKCLEYILGYIRKHFTNMCLIHMFFYSIYFKELVFDPKYPIIIFIWLIMLCIATSNIINIIYKPIIEFIESALNKENTID